MKYVCLRDDDTSYFTDYTELKNAYAGILGRYPITLATVPFVHGSEVKIKEYDLEENKFSKLHTWEKDATVEELTEYYKIHPIGENISLINNLNNYIKSGLIEIAQHGVTHRYNERGAEMFSDSASIYDIRAGKEYLEKCFKMDIQTFIPPSNTLDIKSAKRIDTLGMHIFSSGTPKGATIFEKILSCISDPSPVIEKISRYRQNAPYKTRNGLFVISSFTFGNNYNYDELLNRITNQLNKYGVVGLGTHYWFLNQNEKNREDYQKLIEEISKIEDVCFLTATEYYEMARNKLGGK